MELEGVDLLSLDGVSLLSSLVVRPNSESVVCGERDSVVPVVLCGGGAELANTNTVCRIPQLDGAILRACVDDPVLGSQPTATPRNASH